MITIPMSMRRRGIQESLLDVSGFCQLPQHKPTSETPTLWESKRGHEKWPEVEDRHREARILCRRCPLIAVCEQALSDYEKDSKEVDGVMAGRYCDVGFSSLPQERQSKCAGCGIRLHRQGSPKNIPRGRRRHVGEGLCDECHPKFGRAAA